MSLYSKRTIFKTVLGTCLAGIPFARAERFLTVEEARNEIFGNQAATAAAIELTNDQVKQIERSADVNLRTNRIHAWRMEQGGLYIVGNVIGKHENIDVAVGLDQTGAVVGIEVLVYRETYGHEIRHPNWRAQFYGKNAANDIEIDEDIQNISGATLSCVHLTDYVRGMTRMYQLLFS